MRLLNLLAIGLIILMFISAILPVFENVKSFKSASYILKADQAVRSFVSHTIPTTIKIPTKIPGTVKKIDLTRWIIIATGLILIIVLSHILQNLHSKVEACRKKYKVIRREKKARIAFIKSMISSVKNSKLFNYHRKSKLQKLFRTLAETRRKLDKWSKELTFLSIDIINSTEIKKGEDSAMIEHDFAEYKKVIQGKLESNSCIKFTWTPDGVMSCFIEFGLAFNAANEAIKELENFNKINKFIKTDFVVRCGINSGFVYFDDALSLEKISDRTIDIAAHIQKQAKPNTIYVTKQSIKPAELYRYFYPADKIIDGCEIYQSNE